MARTLEKTISDYEKEGFSGNDASLEISLFEYGLIWKEVKKDEFKFIYGIEAAENEFRSVEYVSFDYGFITKEEFKRTIKESWFRLPEVLSFCGMTDENEFIDCFPYCVADTIRYHGAENIMGSSYYPCKIGKEYEPVLDKPGEFLGHGLADNGRVCEGFLFDNEAHYYYTDNGEELTD